MRKTNTAYGPNSLNNPNKNVCTNNYNRQRFEIIII